MLFNQDSMLYTLLAHALNMGAVGLMKDLLWVWVPMFFACRNTSMEHTSQSFFMTCMTHYPD